MTSTNKQTMERIMTALAAGDRRPFGDAMSDDFAWIFPGNGVWSGAYRGKRVVLEQLMRPLFRQFSGTYTNRAVRILHDGDHVVVECRGEATTKRGDRYDNAYCYVCRFSEGKLVELTEYMDTALAERVLEPPSAREAR